MDFVSRRRVAFSLLLPLAGALGSPAVSGAAEPDRLEQVAHEDGGSCPDGRGTPCGDDCSCPCCHGRSPSLVPPVAQGSAVAPPHGPLALISPTGPVTADFLDRVFRPPRALA